MLLRPVVDIVKQLDSLPEGDEAVQSLVDEIASASSPRRSRGLPKLIERHAQNRSSRNAGNRSAVANRRLESRPLLRQVPRDLIRLKDAGRCDG
jgi:hypothetical protein